jgi:hypothetical protein
MRRVDPPCHPVRLGQGRSGVVFKWPDAGSGDGSGDSGDRFLAVKVFTGEGLADAVHYVFSGAPCAYRWNEAAIRCTVLRRQMLADLVEFWMPADLAVANAVGCNWNEAHRAFELACRFSPGRPAALRQPFSGPRDGELEDLLRNVIEPLQQHLREAGFDGLLWQAGFGNPVATNNFLREATPSGRRWIWIDLESGVPALFPSNPLTLFSFYLPKSFQHRRPLYDDVDVEKLEAYLTDHAEALAQKLGAERFQRLRARARELAEQQREWKRLHRAQRGIQYQLSQGRITREQADWFSRRVPLWYGRELARGTGAAAVGAGRLLARACRLVASIDLREVARVTWLSFSSQQYRAQLARTYVGSRIRSWRDRRQLEDAEAAFLRSQLESETSSYLTDFGMHLAIKPFVKVTQWWAIVPLMAAGVIPPLLGATLLLLGGMLGRTAYTAYRLVGAASRGREKPWAALVTGLLPVVGNVAYPIQITVSGSERDGKLAQFIVLDSFTRLGQLVPIWGGRDTRTEHLFNHSGSLIVRNRESLDSFLPRHPTGPETKSSAARPVAGADPRPTLPSRKRGPELRG